MNVQPRLPGASAPRPVNVGGPLWMIVSDVPADLYSEESLVEGLQDLTWVSRCAVGHEAVAQAYLAKGTVIPMKLLTIFATEKRAVEEISARRPEILESVDRLADRVEWGVRLVVGVRTRAVKPARAARAPRSGRAYLEAKRRLTARPGPVVADAGRLRDRIVKTLSASASDMRRREDIEQTPGSRVRLDAAWLVRRRQSVVFQRKVRGLAAQAKKAGYDLILSGPWPPYHFVEGVQGA